ncbi:MAG: glycoside hydrolase family 11 protein [Oscillospiraceae bacterium]|nr:glycoside hydrolase family 11 protein [Oscillospiraceae bacterium]
MKRKLSAILLTLFIIPMLLIIPSADEAHAGPFTKNSRGEHDGLNYELWHDKAREVTMTVKEKGAFECEWIVAGNVLFRTGIKFRNKILHYEHGEFAYEYAADYQPDGNSYLCVYGWTTDPLIEFYIVESWGSWRPPGGRDSHRGQVEIDGGLYDIYETTRVEQPSIQGKKTFQQFWSVRVDKKTEGIISVSEHMRAWEEHGLILGNMYEVAFCVEGYGSSGYADVTKAVLTIDGEIAKAPETTSIYDEFTVPLDEQTTVQTTQPPTETPPSSPLQTGFFIALAVLGAAGIAAGVAFMISKRKKK